jgi:phage shock protein PspC (stress-responsive transcriptional regulator)
MSNEKDDQQHDQHDEAPEATTPANGNGDLELPAPAPEGAEGPDERREASGELDLHLRGDDAEPDSASNFADDEAPDPGEALPGEALPDDALADEPPPPPYEPPFEPPYEPPFEPYEPRAPLHHRLMRRPEGKVVAGVCSGLGAYTNTDPVLWRIGFVVFGLTSVGVLAYIVAWLVMPEARRGEPLPERPPHEAAQITRWAAIAAIILGCWVIFRGFFHIGGGWFWGLLLIGIGVAVWGRDFTSYRHPSPPSRPTTPPTTRATYVGGQAVRQTAATEPSATSRGDVPTPPANPATSSTGSASAWPGPRSPGPRPDAGAPTTPLPPTRPPWETTRNLARPRPPRRRESSYLGRLVVGACAVVIGIGLVLNNTGVIDLTAKGILAVLVAIIGAGLITGAWAGRARWLIFPGIGLTFALMLATWVPAFASGSFGNIVWQPQSRKALLPSYEHGAGQAVLDLTEVTFDERPREVEVDVNFGELLVVVPDDVPVTVNAHVQGGEIDNFGTVNDGWDIGNTRSESGDEDIGRLTIDAEVAFGELMIRRERPGDDFTPGVNNDDFQFNFGDRRLGRR